MALEPLRDRVVKELTRHCGEGRLTLDELEERIEAAYAAESEDDLRALVADLPTSDLTVPTPAPPRPSPPATPPPRPMEHVPHSGKEVGLPDPAKALGLVFTIGGFILMFNGMWLLALICWFVLPGLVIHDRRG